MASKAGTAARGEFWNGERLREVERLWKGGKTASQIAAALGCTRAAAGNKVIALGLSGSRPYVGAWPDEDIEALKKHLSAGCSSGRIALLLGQSYSRNAVIGKINRLGLKVSPRAHALHNAQGKTIIQRKRSAQKVIASNVVCLPAPEAVRAPGGALLTLMDMKDGMCRWPHGDPDHADFHFCGHVAIAASPWCSYHRTRAAGKAVAIEP